MILDQVSGESYYKDSETLLLYWQKKIFTWLFSLLLVAGFLPFLLGCRSALENGQGIRIFFYSSLYIWVFGVLFLKKIPFEKRMWAGLLWFYAMGLFFLGAQGFVGSSQLYFFCFLSFGAVFFGGRGGGITLLMTMVTLFLAGVLDFQGTPLPGLGVSSSMVYTIHVGTFLLLGSAVTFTLAILINALEVSGKKQATLEKKLVQLEKLKNLGILAGSVAHDLNNILSGIATYPEVLLMEEGLAPRMRQGLGIIKDSGQKASSVVSDLLTISRGANREMEVLNINSVIERYMKAADFDKIKATYQQVQIEVVLAPELRNIKGSYIHIEKAIMNLVVNGVEEAVQREAGQVTISTANHTVEDSMAEGTDLSCGDYVMLSVADNGFGIPEEYREKIFDPFFTKKTMGRSGTGLGLTVVWNTVQDHQGNVRVVSSKKGTRFELFFPAIREALPQKEINNSPAEIKGQGQRILIVDDLANQRKITGTILKNLGYQVFAVADGMAAVAFVRENPVDLLVLDMVMEPSISGLETYQQIKKIYPDQKAILASGHSKSEEVLIAQDLGAGAFLKKPYTILDIGIAVKEELEKSWKF
jgi:signal transduction histidine kinase/CheY-like chemotaxis protein